VNYVIRLLFDITSNALQKKCITSNMHYGIRLLSDASKVTL